MNITIEIGGPLADAINNLAAALDRHSNMNAVLVRDTLQFAEINSLKTPTEKASTSTKARAKKPDTAAESAESAETTTIQAPAETKEPAPTPTETTAVTETASEAPSLKDLQTEILRVAREKGHDAAAALLAQFGARKVSEVKPEDGARLIAAAKEI